MSTILQFLNLLSDFFTTIFSYHVIPGISLFTVLIYNFGLVVFFNAYVRRG